MMSNGSGMLRSFSMRSIMGTPSTSKTQRRDKAYKLVWMWRDVSQTPLSQPANKASHPMTDKLEEGWIQQALHEAEQKVLSWPKSWIRQALEPRLQPPRSEG